jgi:hypothetical protein
MASVARALQSAEHGVLFEVIAELGDSEDEGLSHAAVEGEGVRCAGELRDGTVVAVVRGCAGGYEARKGGYLLASCSRFNF